MRVLGWGGLMCKEIDAKSLVRVAVLMRYFQPWEEK